MAHSVRVRRGLFFRVGFRAEKKWFKGRNMEKKGGYGAFSHISFGFIGLRPELGARLGQLAANLGHICARIFLSLAAGGDGFGWIWMPGFATLI